MNKIHVEVIVNASLEKAWEYWNSPEKIQGWAFASDDWECPYAENHLEVGGKFTTRMSAKDKSMSFDFGGVYTNVEKYKKISYVMSADMHDINARKCDVTFTDLGDGTVKVEEDFDAESQNSVEMQKNGWQSILNNYKKLIEKSE